MIRISPKALSDTDEVPEFSSEEESPNTLIQFEASDDEGKGRIVLQQVSAEGRMPTDEMIKTVVEVENATKGSKTPTKGSIIKAIVSKEKQRYNLDGFDLDLTYITNQMIAMGFPSEKIESIYRNSMEDVQSFFNLRHAGHFMILNLCSEKKYKHSCFQGMVKEFPFDDHQAPPFRLVFETCQFIDEWLKASPENVVGVHCKAGKGRTGVICCSYLLYTGVFKTAKDALKYYGLIRTKNRKGVTIPSQIRYVEYFELAMKSQWKLSTLPRQTIELDQIILSQSPNINLLGGSEPHFRLICDDKVYLSKDIVPIQQYKSGQVVNFSNLELTLEGDVLVEFYNNSVLKQERIFQIWFNTIFIRIGEENIFKKHQLDKAVRDKEHKRFAENFTITIHAKQAKKTSPLIVQKIQN